MDKDKAKLKGLAVEEEYDKLDSRPGFLEKASNKENGGGWDSVGVAKRPRFIRSEELFVEGNTPGFNELYCLPFNLSSAPHTFTKLSRSVMAEISNFHRRSPR